MRVILAGGGRVAFFLARSLRTHGHQVVVCDGDETTCADFASRLGVEARVCDPTSPEGLEDAEAGSADTLIAVSRDDARNLVTCQLALVRFSVPRVVALVNDPENEALFRAVGVESVFSPARVMASLLEQHAGLDGVIALAPAAGGKVLLSEVKIGDGAAAAGKRLRDLALPPGSLAGCILRGGGAFVPNGDSEIAAGDRVVVIAVAEAHERAVAALASARA
ncbi:MAG: Trk system potassium uptake protein TrkA [Planctomycetes bacterium]|nr:Trk system potassium uptake protein TrkA [Planctomycetota bacterium]